MISKQMYRLLTEIPHSPITTSFQEIADKQILDISLLKNLLNNAVENKYIAYPSRVRGTVFHNPLRIMENTLSSLDHKH